MKAAGMDAHWHPYLRLSAFLIPIRARASIFFHRRGGSVYPPASNVPSVPYPRFDLLLRIGCRPLVNVRAVTDGHKACPSIPSMIFLLFSIPSSGIFFISSSLHPSSHLPSSLITSPLIPHHNTSHPSPRHPSNPQKYHCARAQNVDLSQETRISMQKGGSKFCLCSQTIVSLHCNSNKKRLLV